MTLSDAEAGARLEEYRALRPVCRQDELALLETALFLEEALGIQLTDAEIAPDTLGSFDSIRRLVALRRSRA
jgi:hypothetical protein